MLIENLNAIVAAVADEETPLGVERQRVGLIELDGPGSFLAHDRDQLSVLGELQNARIGAAVSFGDEDVAVGRGRATSFGW